MFEKEKKAAVFYNYNPSWESEAEKTINQLKSIFNGNAADIQHIGGTAMKKIKSKPVIDIVVGVTDLNTADSFKHILTSQGFVYYLKSGPDKKLFFKYGNSDELNPPAKNNDVKTHNIHIVQYGGKLWFEYIIFRDYINSSESKAREYESLKLSINGKYKYALPSYIKAKSEFIKKTISENFYTMMLGKTITVTLDHKSPGNYPKYSDGTYPLISGYAKNLIISGDKKQETYVIGVYDYDMPEVFTGRIIAYINREGANGREKSFIVAKDGMIFYKPDIYEAVKFYFRGKTPDADGVISVVCLYEKSCGAVVYTDDGGNIKFLLVKGSASNRVGFPKGHVEKGETEAETAIREIYEETSLNVVLHADFREEYAYNISGYIQKKVIYFIAEFNIRDKYKIRDSEILEQWLIPYGAAYDLLTFNQDKIILKKAYEKIINGK